MPRCDGHVQRLVFITYVSKSSSGSLWLALIYYPILLHGIHTLVTLGFFFLPTASSISLPGLGSKDGWEHAPSHVALRLAPLGSWLQIPHTRLSVFSPAIHRCDDPVQRLVFTTYVSKSSSWGLWLTLISYPIALRGIHTFVTCGFSFFPQLLASHCPGLD